MPDWIKTAPAAERKRWSPRSSRRCSTAWRWCTSRVYLHRDIKPGNIYVREDGTPVLLDFGSARQRATELTAIVSPGYAPFEQYHTQGNQGPWSDLYALGGVLYWLVTGERPHEAAARIRADTMPSALQTGDRNRYRPGSSPPSTGRSRPPRSSVRSRLPNGAMRCWAVQPQRPRHWTRPRSCRRPRRKRPRRVRLSIRRCSRTSRQSLPNTSARSPTCW